jgi:hypothetical protein
MLTNGTLVYQLAAMTELPLAAVVVEGRYPKLFEARFVKDGWLPDILARLQIRYREIPIVFADSRKFAEEWTYRFLATAIADLGETTDARQTDQNGMSSASVESHSEVSAASTTQRSAPASAKRSSSRKGSASSR